MLLRCVVLVLGGGGGWAGRAGWTGFSKDWIGLVRHPSDGNIYSAGLAPCVRTCDLVQFPIAKMNVFHQEEVGRSAKAGQVGNQSTVFYVAAIIVATCCCNAMIQRRRRLETLMHR